MMFQFRAYSTEPFYKNKKEQLGGYINPSRLKIDQNGILDDSHKENIEIELASPYKDRNNEVIYQNDLIKFIPPYIEEQYSQSPPCIYVMCFDFKKGFFCCEQNPFSTKDYYSVDVNKMSSFEFNKNFEIIGNIHDNPELLETKNEK